MNIQKFSFYVLSVACIFVCRAHCQFIYLNDAVVKFIVGLGLPVDITMPGGSVSWFTNLQVFYRVPNNVSYYEPYKIVQKRSAKQTFNRYAVYQALGKYFNRLGFSGKECVNRIICEVAKRKLDRKANGLLGEIIHIFFSPAEDTQRGLEEHKNAQRQGLYNSSDCEILYRDCGASKIFKQYFKYRLTNNVSN